MRTIAISSKDIQPNSNNSTFHYVFPQSVVFKNQEIALSSLTMFNSVYNISSALNNNKFQYIWSSTTYTLTLPDGIYEVSDINAYLLFSMKANNHYLVDLNDKEVYFLEFIFKC